MVQKNPTAEIQKMLLLAIILVIMAYVIHDILYGYMRRREMFRSFDRHSNRDQMMKLMIKNEVKGEERDKFILGQD